MIWNKISIKTTTNDTDMVCATLMDLGINDVEIENNVQLDDEEMNHLYAILAKEAPVDDGVCHVNVYLEVEDSVAVETGGGPAGAGGLTDGCAPAGAGGLVGGCAPASAGGLVGGCAPVTVDNIRAALDEASGLFGIEPVEITSEIVNSENWENKWKEYFKPFYVDDIVIKPTWEEMPDDIDGKILIEIDPGMAFGTGMHETTRLCLRGLSKYLKPGNVVTDFGCGSGILSIAALKMGAVFANAIDIDPQATVVARENFDVNNIPESCYMLRTGNVLEDGELKADMRERPADLVLANILADVVEPLTASVHDYLKSGGIYVTSGIIDNKEQLIVDAVKANPELEFIEVVNDGDWRSIVARRV